MLKVINLTVFSKIGKKKLLDKVSFELKKGEIHCLLGKNGSGKTTLARVIMGLGDWAKVEGKINFLGKEIGRKKTFERAQLGISMAFQEPARFEGLSVEDFLLASLRGKQKKNKYARDKILKEALNLVDLEESILTRKIDQSLSGGERKRIELASLIVMKPKLMILDEPDASLDIIVYNEFYDLLLKIRRELGVAILLITHREEAGLVADVATLIEKGKTIVSGRFRAVMRNYCQREGRQERCLLGRKGRTNN